jgi:hypothetical protein
MSNYNYGNWILFISGPDDTEFEALGDTHRDYLIVYDDKQRRDYQAVTKAACDRYQSTCRAVPIGAINPMAFALMLKTDAWLKEHFERYTDVIIKVKALHKYASLFKRPGRTVITK